MVPAVGQSAAQFSVMVPLEYLRRIRPGDPDDPLLRQVEPMAAEMANLPGFRLDPVGDQSATVHPGLIQKYAGRALMVATGSCAVHCRYCFRRHFSYAEMGNQAQRWRVAADYLAADPTIREVILSGGDPLMMCDDDLDALVSRLARIAHLGRLRVHTRLPIMIPPRVTTELVRILTDTRLTTTVVVHVNHAAELDVNVGTALGRLIDAGIPVLNQSVLLRGVNDNLAALVALSTQLIQLRVMPYYLHQLDRVAGAAHFEVPVERGIELIEHMRRALPGYAVPRYVCETPGAASKTALA